MGAQGDPTGTAFDAELADRVRAVAGAEPGLTERRMFGGLAFLVHGNLAVSASGRGGLLVRTAPADAPALLARPHVGPFQMRGRDLAGWLRVGPAALDTDEDLRLWVTLGLAHARTLPPK